jgi:hypothetical protein
MPTWWMPLAMTAMLPTGPHEKIEAMRQAAIVASLAVAALLTGCGSSGPKSNGEASKSAKQIAADAQAAALGASTVHVSGSAGAHLSVNLQLVAGKGGEGQITANGLTFQIVRIGKEAYFKGDATFWRHFGGGAAAALLQGKWLKEPAASGRLASLTPITDITRLFNAIFAKHGTLVVGKATSVSGHPVIAVVDKTQGGTLFVATTGKPYPLALRKRGSGSITFDDWNAPVTLTPPSGAVPLP